ncbi:MAG: Si-specific NAD(P)(+) transhydrogenase [Oligoflexia bacterium]|nr:Si-specific NAD(P)(+) transhydrogenase [Oligoflexia bacterium]
MLFDLIVIGSGPAGKSAALEAARAGRKVALVEELPELGGACVHRSTIPSKAFREAVREAGFALGRGPTRMPTMARLLDRRDGAVSSEARLVSGELKAAGVATFHGRARFTSPNDVEVASEKGVTILTSSLLIVAVGASPRAPARLKVAGRGIFDSDSILSLPKVPKSLLVLGGGIVGCEYASMFAALGTRVTLVDRRQEILAAVDREIVRRLTDHLERQGAEIVLESEAETVTRAARGQGVQVQLSGRRKLRVDAVLVAQGRHGNTEGLGLTAAGVETDERGLIPVDRHFRTSVGHIFAAGDVVGPPAFASTGMEEGTIAARNALRIPGPELPALLPYVIFTLPEISMVGRTEEDLRESGSAYVAGRADFRELARGRLRGGSLGGDEGLLKLLVDPESRRLLGVHAFGEGAAELIHLGQAVMSLGADIHYLAQAVFNYPTLSEAYKTAASRALDELQAGRPKAPA